MKAKRVFAFERQVMLWGFLLLQTIAVVYPARSEVTDWSSFARSVNAAFGPDRATTIKNVILIILLSLAMALLLKLFQFFFSKEVAEQREDYKQYKDKRRLLLSQQEASQQHRDWFRLLTHMDFKWTTIGQEYKTLDRFYTADKMHDISAGGICFTTMVQLHPGQEIVILLASEEVRPFKIHGKVLRVKENSDPPALETTNNDQPDALPYIYDIAVKFIGMPPREQERLASWIIQCQRQVIHQALDEPREEITADPDPFIKQ